MVASVKDRANTPPRAEPTSTPEPTSKPLDIPYSDLMTAIQKTLERGMEEERKPREKKFQFGEGVQEPEE
jgi:hypothetical protein